MKREIKFRGKRIDNGEWVYGGFVVNNGYAWIIGGLSGITGDWLDDIVDPETVGQFTGLKDKNGVEIFEGDVITLPSWVRSHVVVYNTYEAGFGFSHTSCEPLYTSPMHYVFDGSDNVICEVIGNLTDNPELLEEI